MRGGRLIAPFHMQNNYHSTSVNSGRPTVQSAEEAYQLCMALATSHYENFPVGSVLLPKDIRRHVYAVYAFSRIADDIADEPWTSSQQQRCESLDALQLMVEQAATKRYTSGDYLLVAVSNSIHDHRVDASLLIRLLTAFRSDVLWNQPRTWQDVMGYCDNSANPVGRLVLGIAGHTNLASLSYSDDVCTALQLVNFWQDLSIDAPRGRSYLPLERVTAIGEEATLIEGLRLTRQLLYRGANVVNSVSGRLGFELRAIIAAGDEVLTMCERLQIRLKEFRPMLTRTSYLWILMRCLTATWRPRIAHG
jgi:squalene synthase HpnC